MSKREQQKSDLVELIEQYESIDLSYSQYKRMRRLCRILGHDVTYVVCMSN